MIPRNSLFYKLSKLGLSSKIVRILQRAYENTESQICDGNTLSDFFAVEIGVKQGCILSPLLFSLYVNDLPDELPGGVNVAGTNVKILLYADDIVLLSDSPDDLQHMIDALYVYCSTWCLKVNLDKSKIVIFRAGTRISSNLNWHYGVQDIEIVKEYKYLGIIITYNLSFKKHLISKLSASKLAINSTWSKYLTNPQISKCNKIKIFHAASRSIMLYAAQVWGYEKYDEVEKLFRFFVKKMLYLPSNTPNYILHLETDLDSLYLTTLKLHFNYINKVLNLNQHRLPRVLAENIILQKVYWAEEWSNLCIYLRFSPPCTELPLCAYSKSIINLLRIKERENYIMNATNSQHHDLYSQLNHSIISLTASLSTNITSTIIKARSGLLNLNARSFSNNATVTCTICNLQEPENTFHFIGVCPIFSGYRKRYLGKSQLTMGEVINLLNGQDFVNLYKYITVCLSYRKLINNEFEF